MALYLPVLLNAKDKEKMADPAIFSMYIHRYDLILLKPWLLTKKIKRVNCIMADSPFPSIYVNTYCSDIPFSPPHSKKKDRYEKVPGPWDKSVLLCRSYACVQVPLHKGTVSVHPQEPEGSPILEIPTQTHRDLLLPHAMRAKRTQARGRARRAAGFSTESWRRRRQARPASADHRDAPVQRYKHPVVSRRRELGACPTSSCTCIVPLAGILAPSLTASPHQLARPYRRGQMGRVPPRCQGSRQVSPLPIRMFLLPGSPTAAGHGNPPPSASGAWR